MKGQKQKYHFSFRLSSGPTDLWPYISDTNRNFRLLGAASVYQASVSRNLPKGHLELSHNRKKSYAIWQEEPYTWEKPYRFGFKRVYKAGFLKLLQVQVNLNQIHTATEVTVQIEIVPARKLYSLCVKFFMEQIIKRRLEKLLNHIDDCVQRSVKPYETRTSKKSGRVGRKRLEKAKEELGEKTKRQRIVNHLIDFLEKADEEDLHRIHPYALAEYWGEKKYAVLNVFLNAAKQDLLDFSWDVCCPSCKNPRHNFRKLREVPNNLYCKECDIEYQPDFNKNMHLVFRPNPLIRKLTPKNYCLGGPNSKPHRVIQQYLKSGETRYLNVRLEEGTYLLRCHNNDGFVKLNVREDGADNVTFYISDAKLTGEEITISTHPNLVLKNRSSESSIFYVDNLNWKQEAIYASEVCSSSDFTSQFSKETIKDNHKLKSSGVTMLFTDLMNSTELYLQEGDELAIGRVMSHFKIIQQIVAEERGGIVKTIGDSVMAVFREPVSALKAVQRIQQIFTTSSSMSNSFKLKAGIHFGDCTAVNLNGRTDYFGTTVNIAARLVEAASEKELMVSEAVYNHPDVQLYLDKNSKTFFVKETLKELKGFDDEEFIVKQIRMERPPMKLVI